MWIKRLIVALVCAGVFCIAQQGRAQLTLTGVGGGFGAGSQPLLDSLSATSIAAFSTRKLRAAYAGNALTVTTSQAGNATQAIGFVNGNLDTASLATFIGSNSGSVATWNDQSATAHNATQGTVAAQPVIVNAGTNNTKNGHVCGVWSSGSSTVLNWSPPAQNQPVTWAIAFQLSATLSGGHMVDGSADRLLSGQGSAVWQEFAGSALTGGTSDTNFHTWIAIFNGASSSVVLDGSTIISGNAGTNSYSGANAQLFGEGSGGTFMSGSICELIAFSSSISGADQSAIRSSWQSYWGAP